jgi:arginase
VHSGLQRDDHAIVWLDAHPDFDTPDECLSGYFDGMGVATLAGQCWQRLAATILGYRPFDSSRFVYCGIRDFSPEQKAKVRAARPQNHLWLSPHAGQICRCAEGTYQ